MAIDYTALFTSIGKLVKHFNLQASDAQSLLADVLEIETVFAAEDHLEAISGLNPNAYESWLQQHAGRRGTLAGYAANRLRDPDLLIELGAPDADLSRALAKLIEQMNIDSESINASAAAAGAPATIAAVGNGTVVATLLLDGITSPGSRQGTTMPAHHEYADLPSQLVIAETLIFRCTGDSFVDFLSEGAEQFLVTGTLPDSQYGVATQEGSGTVGIVSAAHADTSRFLQNADFETWSVADTPDNWTIVTGTAATHIFQESTTIYHGLSALQLRGDGALAAIEITQAPGAGALRAGQRYFVACRIRCDVVPAAGAVTIALTGTGYTPGALEKITIAAASLPTSYTLYSFNVLIPVDPPDDLALSIKWSGTPTTARKLFVDDIAFQAVQYGAGLGYNILRGDTPFVREDRFSIALTNTEGVFQKFLRRAFGIQLPSNAAAGETIADSLAI